MKENLVYFLPELTLTGTALILLFADFILGAKKKGLYPVIAFVGIHGMILANAALANLPPAHFFGKMLTFDAMGGFFKYLFGGAGLFGILLARRSSEVARADLPSFYTLLVLLILGMNLLATSNNLLMIYLSLEMVSVLSYILTGSLHGIRRSSEAALKYVIYGGVASGIMAFGMSILYGLTGSLDLQAIAQAVQGPVLSRPLLFTAVVLMMAGFGYKIAAFPFHMWCPDVYEGAPTPFTAFLSVGPKAAGFAILIRFCLTTLSQPRGDLFFPFPPIGLQELLGLLSIATMIVGNVAALVQTNLKRLLAYSSIAHAGYLLMGFTALNQEALSAILFYLVVYLIMNIGAFLVVILVGNELGVEDLRGWQGLGRRGRFGTFLALAMSVFLLSLTGIPPMAGFAGKFYLFGALIRAGLYGLALIGVLNSVISLTYYVRVIKVMFFDESRDLKPMAMPLASHSFVLATLAALTLYLGLFWNPLAQWASGSTGILLK